MQLGVRPCSYSYLPVVQLTDLSLCRLSIMYVKILVTYTFVVTAPLSQAAARSSNNGESSGSDVEMSAPCPRCG
jgi:hypothetical protein